MKSLKRIVFLAMLLTLAIGILSAHPSSEVEDSYLNDDTDDTSSRQGVKYRFLAQRTYVNKGAMTCDSYPRVCRTKGSPGPDCCKKKCVNVSSDKLNCGMCGKRCKYQEICCKGNCVNPMTNAKNCGGCNKKCKKGSSCAYGMCSYA